jgi:hypothetical protein
MTTCVSIASGLSNVQVINLTSSGSVTNLIVNATSGTTLTVSGDGGAVQWYVMGNGAGPGECSSSLTVSCTLYKKLVLKPLTVSTLPTASTVPSGTTYTVSDATTFTVGTCTGSGSDTMIAVSNGTTWSCH